MVACLFLKKVFDQLVTPTPNHQQTTLKSSKHSLFNTMNNICYMFNTKTSHLILAYHTEILCNGLPPGEVLPGKELSFVTRDHTNCHINTKIIAIINQLITNPQYSLL